VIGFVAELSDADFGLQMINPGRSCEWAADPDRDLEILVHRHRF
jgi:hypothetical protein